MSGRLPAVKALRAACAAAVLTCLVGACSPTPATEIVVLVSTDLARGAALRSVQVIAQRSGAATALHDRTYGLTDARFPLPGEVVLVAADPDDTRPVTVRVVGDVGGRTLRQDAVVRFRRERTLYVQMTLSGDCVGQECATGLTCRAGVCVAPEQAPVTETAPTNVLRYDAAADVGGDAVDASSAEDRVATDVPVEADAGVVDVPAVDAVDVPVVIDVPVAVDVPVVMDVPVAVDVPVVMDVPVAVDVPVAMDVPVAVDVPVAIDVVDVSDIPRDVPADVTCSTDSAVCGPGQFCVAGVCACPSGVTACGVGCVDLSTDPANCGGCGRVCPVACSAGMCVTVTEAVSGEEFRCARLSNGTVRCWGNNDAAQAGVGYDGPPLLRPTAIDGFTAGSLAAGSRHGLAVRDGRVYCWGESGFEQCDPAGSLTYEPTSPPALSDVAQAAGGERHTCVLRTSGEVLCWGDFGDGRGFADGRSEARLVPGLATVLGTARILGINARGRRTCVWTDDDRVLCWGPDELSETPARPGVVTIPGTAGLGLAGVAVGANHTCAWHLGESPYCWGDNDLGQLGTGATSPTRVTTPVRASVSMAEDVVAGADFTCAVRSGSRGISCWGSNDRGQLGVAGMTASGTPVIVPRLSDVGGLSASDGSVCARLTDGSLRCWGDNRQGQLGRGFASTILTRPRALPAPIGVQQVVAGSAHTCARDRMGAVTCWGDNQGYQLGDGSTTSRPLPLVPTGLGATTGLAARVASCALDSVGVRCWGSVAGVIQRTPTPITTLSGLVGITPGRNVCAWNAPGNAWCWGANGNGQLGVGTFTTSEPLPTPLRTAMSIVQIATAAYHSCGVVAGGGILCWGSGSLLGLGPSVSDSAVPVVVPGLEQGVEVVVATNYSCARMRAGTVLCWGDNTWNQMGDGTTVRTRSTPVMVLGISDAIAIATGDGHVCALRRGGTVACWGLNLQGEVGNGETSHSVRYPTSVEGLSGAVGIAAGGGHTCTWAADGLVTCWGWNERGQLGEVEPAFSVVHAPVIW